MPFIGIWKKTSSKLISKSKQKEGEAGRERYSFSTDDRSMAAIPYVDELSIQKKIKCQSLCSLT